MLVVNLTRDSDPPAVLAAIQAICDAWQPEGVLPRLVHCDAAADMAPLLEAVPGVLNVTRDALVTLDLVIEPGYLHQQRVGHWSSGYTAETTGAGVPVYLLDSGVSPLPAFSSLERIYDAHPWQSLFNHGTRMGSMIAADSHGIAPGVDLKDVRWIDGNGAGTISGGNAAFAAVLGRPRGVVSCSWGFDQASNPFAAAIDALLDEGFLIVCSAGNAGRDVGASPRWPGADPDVICVGSAWTTRRPYSNWGTPVDIFANGWGFWLEPDGSEGDGHGTSASTAFVAAALARLIEGATLTSRADGAHVRDVLLQWAKTTDPDAPGTTDRLLHLPHDRVWLDLPTVSGWTYD